MTLEREVVKYLVLAALILGGLGGAYFKGRNDAGDEWEQKVAVLTANAEAQEGVVMQLRQANATWARLHRARLAEVQGAVTRAERETKRILAENARLKRELDEVYRDDPEAAAWADQPVPPAVLDRLRSHDSDGDPD